MNARGACRRLDDVAAELALGLLDGEERASALVHLEQCVACQAEVASLTGLGEQILLLAPEVPPPLGFETRVLTRIQAEAADAGLSRAASAGTASDGRRRRGPGRWARRHMRPLAAAAAVLLVVGAAAVGLAGRGSDADETVAAMRSSRGAVLGEATLQFSAPAVVELDVEDWVEDWRDHPDWPEGDWWLGVEKQGDQGEMHRYPLPIEEAPVEVTLDEDAADVVSVAVMDDTGKVWCEGRFER